MSDWIDFNVFHIPPGYQELELNLEDARAVRGYYDPALGEFRRLVGPVGAVRERVLSFRLTLLAPDRAGSDDGDDLGTTRAAGEAC